MVGWAASCSLKMKRDGRQPHLVAEGRRVAEMPQKRAYKGQESLASCGLLVSRWSARYLELSSPQLIATVGEMCVLPVNK